MRFYIDWSRKVPPTFFIGEPAGSPLYINQHMRRSDIVAVFVGSGPEREVLSASWDDDAEILRIIHELNFGKFRMSL